MGRGSSAQRRASLAGDGDRGTAVIYLVFREPASRRWGRNGTRGLRVRWWQLSFNNRETFDGFATTVPPLVILLRLTTYLLLRLCSRSVRAPTLASEWAGAGLSAQQRSFPRMWEPNPWYRYQRFEDPAQSSRQGVARGPCCAGSRVCCPSTGPRDAATPSDLFRIFLGTQGPLSGSVMASHARGVG